jgi:hypothetical protein
LELVSGVYMHDSCPGQLTVNSSVSAGTLSREKSILTSVRRSIESQACCPHPAMAPAATTATRHKAPHDFSTMCQCRRGQPNKQVQNGAMTLTVPAAATLTPERLRAWAWHKQGLDGSLNGKSSEEVLDHAGWARSVGGANPYLTLFARAGINREQADQDVKALRIHELPTARGCTYVLGQRDYPWALQIGRDAAIAPFKVLARLGVERGEITLLEDEVEHALKESGGPMDPKQLRDVLGDSVRSLGEEGQEEGRLHHASHGLGAAASRRPHPPRSHQRPP